MKDKNFREKISFWLVVMTFWKSLFKYWTYCRCQYTFLSELLKIFEKKNGSAAFFVCDHE